MGCGRALAPVNITVPRSSLNIGFRLFPSHVSGEKKDVMTAVIVSTAAIRTYSAATDRRNRPPCTGPWTRAGASRHLFAAASPMSTAKPTALAMSNLP
jgi:hypothetical protein